jgi:hypothetical protein
MDAVQSLRLASLAVAVCGTTLACANGAAPAAGGDAAMTNGSAGERQGAAGAAGTGAAGTGVVAGAAGQDAAAGGDAAPAADGPNKTIVLGVASADGLPLGGVASFAVTIMENGARRTQEFAHDKAVAIVGAAPVELSLAVEPSDSGAVSVIVDARDAGECKLATALINVVLVDDAVIHAAVALQRLDECAAGDGGASDGVAAADGGPARFPGCDPAKTTCGDDMTCEIRCATKTAACTASGDGFPGSTCASSADCAAGSECVDYAAAGCAVKICRRFCAEDANCPQPISFALPRNACAIPLACGGAATAYRACSVSCDPTFATRANGDSSCPAQLDCLLLDPDHADCGCFVRNGLEGETCAAGDHCSPGLVCNAEGTTSKCRAVCRCNVENGACAAVIENACPKAGTHCAPLAGGTVFGVCVP